MFIYLFKDFLLEHINVKSPCGIFFRSWTLSIIWQVAILQIFNKAKLAHVITALADTTKPSVPCSETMVCNQIVRCGWPTKTYPWGELLCHMVFEIRCLHLLHGDVYRLKDYELFAVHLKFKVYLSINWDWSSDKSWCILNYKFCSVLGFRVV